LCIARVYWEEKVTTTTTTQRTIRAKKGKKKVMWHTTDTLEISLLSYLVYVFRFHSNKREEEKHKNSSLSLCLSLLFFFKKQFSKKTSPVAFLQHLLFTLMYRLARNINYKRQFIFPRTAITTTTSNININRVVTRRININTRNNKNISKRTLTTTKMGSGGEGNEIEKKAKMMSEEDLFENKLRVKKLSEHATIPVRGSDGAAGYDLSAAYDCVVKAKSKELVKTDLSIAIPKNTYARIAPRSGLAYKKFIDVLAGVVDYDYRGNVGVILANFGDEDFEVKKGDRIAQMILERITTPECVEVEDLEATERGAGGFGSTGVSK
jgi:dUTP pyrophosphatase